MSETRTIEWASVAGWVSENEQQIRDVMKFEGLKGAMVEVLRLAPDQPELAALREELAELEEEFDTLEHSNITLKQRLAEAERRNAVYAELLNGWLAQFPKPGVTGGPITTLKGKTLAALNHKPEASSHD